MKPKQATYKLVPLLQEYGGEQNYTIKIEATCNLENYLVVTYDAEKVPPNAARRFRATLEEKLGTNKILVLPDNVKFARFVPVDEPAGGVAGRVEAEGGWSDD